MIPTIEDILMYVATGTCTPEKAMGWINQHMEDSSLRDGFAMAALPALVPLLRHHDLIAMQSYAVADAMMVARKAPPPAESKEETK